MNFVVSGSGSIDGIPNEEDAGGAMARSPDRDVLSVDEVQDVFFELDEDAHLLIGRAAARLVALSSGFDQPSDLIHEALVAILSGRRTIPRCEPVAPAFIMVMKSLLYHMNEKQCRFAPIDAVAEPMCSRPTPEAEALATEEHRRAKNKVTALRTAFANDEVVSAILMGYEEEMSLPEVGAHLDISHKDLEAGRKRLSRWIERQGWKNDR